MGTTNTATPLDARAVRAAFPVLREAVYLNTGTYGPMAAPALDALLEATRALEEGGVACRVDLTGARERARARLAALLHAEPEEIAITGNATDGTNLALAGLTWRRGDEVITTDEEHAAQLHPLLYLRRRRGVRLRRVSVSPDPAAMARRLDEAAVPRTRMVVASHVSCETGTRLPAAAIAAWARGRGALSLLDGAQAVGVLDVDVRGIGCDFYTGNGHKWLCGPQGTGFFYARRDRMAALSPAHVGAGSLRLADFERRIAEPWPTGARFEFGTRSYALPVGLLGALDWLEALGWDRARAHVAALTDDAKRRIADRPWLRLHTPVGFAESSGLVSFSVEGGDAGALVAALQCDHAIYTRHVPHHNALRISAAHFNAAEDLDRLFAALDGMAAH